MLNFLVIAPHPDDAEIFCGGTLALIASRNQSTGIIDLTQGEMGTRGSVELRKKEAAEASRILGIKARENLSLPDCGIDAHKEEHVHALVRAIRKLNPEIIAIPDRHDRHPDHTAAYELCYRAVFFAGLKNYGPTLGQPIAPPTVLIYQLREDMNPSFVVDVSAQYQKKCEAVRAYASQVGLSNQGEGVTLFGSQLSLSSLEARDAFLGAKIGVPFGEAFSSPATIAIKDPVDHFARNPNKMSLYFPRHK